jgi:hypothetical protein
MVGIISPSVSGANGLQKKNEQGASRFLTELDAPLQQEHDVGVLTRV